MAQSSDKFAQLLTEAIYQIRLLEHKNISIVQDEVGYAIGRDGGSPIEYWRKGHIPKEREEIERLCEVLIERGKVDEEWLREFLDASGYIAPQPLINHYFPQQAETQITGAAPPKPVRSEARSTLPLNPTPFIGRVSEIDEVHELASNGNSRLVTLLGPGGIGKTRLAVEVGRRFESDNHFEDGVVYVPLAPVARAVDIPQVIAQSLNLQLSGSQDAQSQIIGYLQTQNLLLILDNFENLIEKGSDLVAEILSQAPRINMIITTRERLNLQWEQLYPLNGLPSSEFDEFGEVMNSDAADLFLGCVERSSPGYVVAEADLIATNKICQMVAGFPLALELAASWTTMLSISEIADEITSGMNLLETSRSDVPDRHKSLRAVCEYSVGALEAEDQEIFKRLSVFRGGFSRQAAQSIAGADLMSLGRLLDKSLLRLTGRNRYDLHLILRQYGYEMLLKDAAEYDSISLAHAEYYNDRLVEIAPDMSSFKHKELIEDVGGDLDNVRKMWQNAIKHNRLNLIDKAADGMMLYFHMSGRFSMGVNEFTAALVSADIPPDSILRVRLLNRLGLMHMRLNQGVEAIETFNKAVAISRKINDPLEIPMSHNFLSNIFSTAGDQERAMAFLEENLTLDSNEDNLVFKVSTLNNMGTIFGRTGRYEEAIKVLEEAEVILRNMGQAWGLALIYQIHGEVAFLVGDYASAERYFSVAIETNNDLGYYLGACQSMIQLGESLAKAKRPVEAASELHDALELADILHTIPHMLRAILGLAEVPPLRSNEDLVYEIASLVSIHPATEGEVRQRAIKILNGRPRFPYSHSNGEWLVDVVKKIQ